jgi:hypothetical protein
MGTAADGVFGRSPHPCVWSAATEVASPVHLVGNLTRTLKGKGMYEHTLIVMTSDNVGWSVPLCTAAACLPACLPACAARRSCAELRGCLARPTDRREGLLRPSSAATQGPTGPTGECIGSPCLRPCVHGASIGGGGDLILIISSAAASSLHPLSPPCRLRVRVEMMGSITTRTD